MTDHGNMFGASEFYNAATKAGIKPIIGVEAYIAPGSRFDTRRITWGDPGQKADDVSGSGSYTHLTMVAENAAGLRNLFKLSSLASFEGQLSKWSRMDAELIAEHAEGIIITTGCPSGEVQTRLRLGQDREALESAARWREIVGPDNYFLELMDHGLSIEQRVREGLLEIGRKLGIPPLATNDCHYVTRDAAHNHEALLCVQTGKTLSDPNRFKFDGDGYYLKSAAEMRRLWDDEVPGACDSTLLIAERVQSYARGVGAARPDADLPGARGARPGVLAAPRGGRRAAPALPRRSARQLRDARGLRDRGDLRQGLPVLLPDRRRPDQLREIGGHPGRPRPRVLPPDRWSPTPWASPTSTRSRTGCCSSGSSTPSAPRCPTSTSTSTTAAAGRWCATPPTSGVTTGSPR